jgi:hypothetical protein
MENSGFFVLLPLSIKPFFAYFQAKNGFILRGTFEIIKAFKRIIFQSYGEGFSKRDKYHKFHHHHRLKNY